MVDAMQEPIIRKFLDFLEQDFGKGQVLDQVHLMMERRERRLIINFNDLHEADRELAQRVLASPAEYLVAFDAALESAVNNINPEYGKEWHNRFHVGLEGTFGQNSVTPRTLAARFLNQLVALDGIVTKASLVRPRILKSVHYCEATKVFSEREYRDGASLTGLPTNTVYPTRDDAGNVLSTEYGLCEFENVQTVHIQEMPELAEVGQLPRSADVILSDDLVDKCKPGDRVQVIGVYVTIPSRAQGATNGMFRTCLVAVSLKSLGKEILQPVMTDKDITNIRNISQREDVINLLSRSLAPSIHGHEEIKKGILCVLLGGIEKNLENGTHLRGDVNLLMVGDPSTAKSQLLRFVMQIAPLAISTSGRGSSGVGLTAAVTTDSETKERKLEAGAMVLADRGIVCIDEFDKMSDMDRVAIHEVMEQQTVTISKADIHTSLNARCSVVAAANPVYGSYDRNRKAAANIGLPDSLLSRFDLLFLVLDSTDSEMDQHIAMHVLRNHQYRGVGADGGTSLDVQDAAPDSLFRKVDDTDTPVFEKHDRLLHGEARGDEDKLLTIRFLKKYIHFARTRVRPKLTEEARDAIHVAYADLRANSTTDGMTLPITPRSLETIIRLSTALAKARLSPTIDASDVERAVELLHGALGGHSNAAAQGRRRSTRKTAADIDEEGDNDDEGGADAAAGNDDDGDDDEGDDAAPPPSGARRGAARAAKGKKKDKDEDEEMEDVEESEPKIRGRRKKPAPKPSKKIVLEEEEQMPEEDEEEEEEEAVEDTSGIQSRKKLPLPSEEIVAAIQANINEAIQKTQDEANTNELIEQVKSAGFTENDVVAVLRHLHDTNRLFISGESVFRI